MEIFLEFVKFAILPVAVAWIGGNGFKEYIKGRNLNQQMIRTDRERILYDARWLLNRLESTSYQLMGDFRQDLAFQQLRKHAVEEMDKLLLDFLPFGSLSKNCSPIEIAEQEARYSNIKASFGRAIVTLEGSWLLGVRTKSRLIFWK